MDRFSCHSGVWSGDQLATCDRNHAANRNPRPAQRDAFDDTGAPYNISYQLYNCQ